LSIYHRAGAPVAQLERTQLRCEVAALRDAPVATETRRTPAVYIPPRRICDASGACETRGGYWEPGTLYTVDVNKGLRQRLEGACMADSGFRPVQIDRCPAGLADAAPVRPTEILPTLTAQSCAIVYPDGRWQIVERSR
jgi:hypothetical protein